MLFRNSNSSAQSLFSFYKLLFFYDLDDTRYYIAGGEYSTDALQRSSERERERERERESKCLQRKRVNKNKNKFKGFDILEEWMPSSVRAVGRKNNS